MYLFLPIIPDPRSRLHHSQVSRSAITAIPQPSQIPLRMLFLRVTAGIRCSTPNFSPCSRWQLHRGSPQHPRPLRVPARSIQISINPGFTIICRYFYTSKRPVRPLWNRITFDFYLAGRGYRECFIIGRDRDDGIDQGINHRRSRWPIFLS